MKLILLSIALVICFASTTPAQDVDPKTKKLLDQAAKNGKPIASEITVNDSVHVQAVLIPRVDAERIFGKEIGRNYAVIQLTVGNKSATAALVVHGVFIDYSDWPLSGVAPSSMAVEGSSDKYQASSISSQVASEEYRVVRGQLLDAQTDTMRNRFLRWLTLAGNLAGAFTFSLNEQGIVKGIAAATGVGIPGLATAWPDRTVDQLNRVSDLGFRTNKLVPKESAEVVVCFFPIDRFLTPGFRNLFLKSPALFFAPLQMLADRAVQSDAKLLINDLLASANAIKNEGLTFEKLKSGLPCYMKIRHPDPDRIGYDICLAEMGLETYIDKTTNQPKMRVQVKRNTNGDIEPDKNGNPQVINRPGFYTFLALDFFGNVSLNRITVTVDGSMTVEVNSVAASISELVIDPVKACGDAGNECLWTRPDVAVGIRTGVIRGAYLKGAELKLAEMNDQNITDLKKIDEGSNENELHFSFKLNAPLDNQKKLHFTLTKPAATAGGKALESNTWEYVVAYSPSATSISSVDAITTTGKLIVKGKGFSATPTVSLVPRAGNAVTVQSTALAAVTDTSFEVTLPTGANKLHAGCWQVQVTANKLSSNVSEMFAVAPDPTLDSAKRSDKFIFVKGRDLVDFGSCGGQLISFKAVKADGSGPTDLNVKGWGNGEPFLELPDKLKTGDWKIQVFLKGVTAKKDEKPLTDQ